MSDVATPSKLKLATGGGCCGGAVPPKQVEQAEVKTLVQDYYAKAVTGQRSSGCCTKGNAATLTIPQMAGYREDVLSSIPTAAAEKSFGCGDPLAFSEVKAGETVLDIGSGAGIDCFIAAQKVGPLILLHAVQAAVVGLAASGLSFAGVVLLRQGTTAEGVLYLVLVAALLAFEVGLALYLILRKRKIARLIAEARLAINAADTARARFALHSLAGFLEYRMDASSITYGLGVAALLDGDSGEALRLLREAGANAAAVELRALIHLSQGMTERATRLTKAGLTLSPGEPRLWVMLAACHQAARREDDARTLIDKARKQWPNVGLVRRAGEMLDDGGYLPDLLLAAMPGM